VVRLGVIENDVIYLFHAQLVEVIQEDFLHRRVDRIDKGGLPAAFDQVGVVARPVGERYQRIDQAAVPVHRPDAVNVLFYRSRFQVTGMLHHIRPPYRKIQRLLMIIVSYHSIFK
jgi:hypothetical protein